MYNRGNKLFIQKKEIRQAEKHITLNQERRRIEILSNAKQFFGDLFGNKVINFRCIKGKSLFDFKEAYSSDLQLSLAAKNDKDYEVYFVVNSGGYKIIDISTINAAFIDLDCGRDENKQYYPLEITQNYKKTKLQEIKNFPNPPSYIVETRNGLHCYWLLEPNATPEQFEECENRLIAYFDADKSVKSLCNLMRVPDYFWCKDKDNKFEVKIIERNVARYQIDEIINSCPATHIKVRDKDGGGFQHSDKKKDCELVNLIVPKPSKLTKPDITSTSPNWMVIKYRYESLLKDRLNTLPIKLHTHDEVYDCLKRQELAKFLGVPDKGNFSCIFHKDEKPSATIYTAKDTGHQIYQCFSSNCKLGKQGKTIIQITELLTNYSRYSALKFLRSVYNVTYYETQWQTERKGILEENQRLLMSHEFENIYPEVYKRIKVYLPELYALNGMARELIFTEAYTMTDGSPIFYASNLYLARKFGKDVQAVSKRMGLFTYLGLVIKLNDKDVPKFLLKRAKHEAAKKNWKQTIQFYSVPSYGELSMEYSREKANEFVRKGFTMKGFGRELLLRTLGQEEANRVYPKLEGKQLSEKSEQLSRLIDQFVLSMIDSHGWTTEKEILENVIVKKHKIKERELKAILPELLDKYGLLKTRLNKKLKASIDYKGDSKSYPYIIHRPELFECDKDILVENSEIEVLKVITKVITPKIAEIRQGANAAC